MRFLSCITLSGFMAAAAAQAAPLFFDNFDNSFPGEPGLIGSIWPTWPAAIDHNNLSDNHDHTHVVTSCGTCTNSVRNDPQYHRTLANYHDFGAAAVAVTATAWVFEDNNHIGTAIEPVNIFIGLFGDSASPTDNTDYLLLGLDPTFADYNTYGYKSLSGGVGNTSVTRTAAIAGSADGSRWFKLTIRADSLSKGGQARFYINDALVGTAQRQPGVSLRYFFMGNLNVGGGLTSNYEFWWFDDVSIVAIPEITGITDSGGMVTINFLGASSEQPSDFTLVSSSTVNGVYSSAVGASITGGNGVYQATVPTPTDPAQFYRIQR